MRAIIILLMLVSTARGGAFITCICASTGAASIGQSVDPAPSDMCPNCNGKGKLGDGTVFKICPMCDGTGKVSVTSTNPPGGKAGLTSPSGAIINGVFWHTDYAKAYHEAAGKPLLLFFTMRAGCKYCIVMERFQEANAEMLQDFVCVRMPTDPATLKLWGVENYPYHIVVRNGIIKRRWKGQFVADSSLFGDELRRARDGR